MMPRPVKSPTSHRRVVLLGPQRHVPIVRPAVADLCGGAPAPVALVTAGWEEREAEDAEFREHLGRPVVNLEIWSRVERIFERDPELLAAMRERHDRLRRTQALYRLRLDGLVGAAQELLRRTDDLELVAPELDGALQMLQALDREHQARIAELHRAFDARWRPAARAAVQQHKRELQELLDGAACLCIAGGHVGVLLHRLQLFDLLGLWGERPLCAWSAGAMVLGERIVLFHQLQGLGVDTEVMEAGLGVVRGIVPLPHARRRLDLHDAAALRLLARRFLPDPCILLDDGHRIDWDGRSWHARAGTRRLQQDGSVQEVAT